MVEIERLDSLYFEWLCNIVDANRENNSYYILLKTLHKREFYGFIPNDSNRINDGKKLRELFIDELGIENDLEYDIYLDALSGPCSCLEMMVALAKRVEDDILFDPVDVDHSKEIFWKMVENLGLIDLDDEHYYDKNGTYICTEALTKMLSRGYCRDGNGGLFPLKWPKEDQRTVEIWYQMSAYLDENYSISE